MLKKSINITTNYCLINVKKTTKNGQSKKKLETLGTRDEEKKSQHRKLKKMSNMDPPKTVNSSNVFLK